MKKLLVIGAIALFGAMNAQKNTILVGGDISLLTSKDKFGSTTTNESNTFNFNPRVGYQFTDNWTAGVKLGVGTGKVTEQISGTSYEGTEKINNFTYGVFGRYTQPLSETFAVFGELDVYASNGKVTYSTNAPGNFSSTNKTTGFGVMFTPNLFINFKNSFGLNFNIGGLGYETSKVKDSDFKTNAFGFSFGKGVTVGISKNFGTK
ncbi:outer membrane beta-barrel protein [Epilithonimonas zeae]|uniref:Outer membrane protein beta-barrel domain-containing protein n=1 Tax=Epilithonimonas zeae TaxID=1416779 RepID=A0A1N6HD67_9FLAO|nr:outer membrane beta-barrel protein [Epilithonimonas zeae]SIO17732.1 Outer membrane protein beta-barrel domain-containing protein [Epilithonimonas zeae]